VTRYTPIRYNDNIMGLHLAEPYASCLMAELSSAPDINQHAGRVQELFCVRPVSDVNRPDIKRRTSCPDKTYFDDAAATRDVFVHFPLHIHWAD